jgi:hypothetical protein
MTLRQRLPGFLGLTLIIFMMAGCASVPRADGEMQAFSTLTALPPGATYRFDRLPSQSAADKRAAEVEHMGELALAKVGLRRDDAQARFSVQIGIRVQREDRLDWPDNWRYGWGLAGPRYSAFSPWSSRWSWTWAHSSPWFQREISLTLRDVTTGMVVYETRTNQEGVGGETNALLSAMLDAALVGFPAGSGGVRKTVLQLPDR